MGVAWVTAVAPIVAVTVTVVFDWLARRARRAEAKEDRQEERREQAIVRLEAKVERLEEELRHDDHS